MYIVIAIQNAIFSHAIFAADMGQNNMTKNRILDGGRYMMDTLLSQSMTMQAKSGRGV